LRERFLGKWQGQIRKKLSSFENLPEDAETDEILFNRAKNFLSKLFIKNKGKNILLVGHNNIDKALIAVLTNKNYDEIELIEKLYNTSICIFEISEDKNFKMHLFNCIKHLDN